MGTARIVTQIAAEYGRDAVGEALRRAVDARRNGTIEDANRYVAAAILLCSRR